jgi:hypothetical protein
VLVLAFYRPDAPPGLAARMFPRDAATIPAAIAQPAIPVIADGRSIP